MEGVEDAAVAKETERQSLLMLGAGEQQGAGNQDRDSEPGASAGRSSLGCSTRRTALKCIFAEAS